MKGFSPRNLKYMLKLAKKYPDSKIVQQLVAQIPWGHNIALMKKVEDEEKRIWYMKKTIENGWSRNVLLHWIGNDLYKRQGSALSNLKRTLAAPQSDLAHETLKDPYNFDPRDAGQMNFYLSATDDLLRSPQDNPTIGLLLCRDKKGVKVEYALRDIHKPIGIAEYETKIIESLPENLKGSLPTIEELELEFDQSP